MYLNLIPLSVHHLYSRSEHQLPLGYSEVHRGSWSLLFLIGPVLRKDLDICICEVYECDCRPMSSSATSGQSRASVLHNDM